MNNYGVPLTKHAEARMQQRGISLKDLDLLFEFGKTEHVHCSDKTYFDKCSFGKLLKSGRCSGGQIDRIRKMYVVECDGWIVTVGHRTKRIRH